MASAEYMREYRKDPNHKRAIYESQKRCYLQKPEHYNLYYANKRRERHAKTRLEILEYFGGKCARCGFDDFRALQLDHINGRGIDDYKRFKYAYIMYKYYLNHLDEAKQKLQVLCANCNWIKKYENQEHANIKYGLVHVHE